MAVQKSVPTLPSLEMIFHFCWKSIFATSVIFDILENTESAHFNLQMPFLKTTLHIHTVRFFVCWQAACQALAGYPARQGPATQTAQSWLANWLSSQAANDWLPNLLPAIIWWTFFGWL